MEVMKRSAPQVLNIIFYALELSIPRMDTSGKSLVYNDLFINTKFANFL